MTNNTDETLARIFTLQGDTCIECDGPCNNSKLMTTRLQQLHVNINGSPTGTVYICLAGEAKPYNQSNTQHPELKQQDGVTPRVCLVGETGTISSSTTSPTRG